MSDCTILLVLLTAAIVAMVTALIFSVIGVYTRNTKEQNFLLTSAGVLAITSVLLCFAYFLFDMSMRFPPP
jgi:hypothetical protein